MTIRDKVVAWARWNGACTESLQRVNGRTLLQMWRNASTADRHEAARMGGVPVGSPVACPACRAAARDKPPAKLVRAIRAFKP